jgi:hypothetical protein
MKRRIFFASLLLFTIACALTEGLQPTPTATPINLPVVSPYPAQPARPTATKPPTPTQVVFTPGSSPAWVADFSDPILKEIEAQRPVFKDDFPPVCIDEKRNWKVCSEPEQRLYYQNPLSGLMLATARPTLDLQPDLQEGYALLNKGWFFIMPDSQRNPFYAHVDSGMLVLKLPEGKINKDLKVYNPYLAYKNFVLKLDFEFLDTQPDDAIRFEFNQSADQSIALDLSKNKTWTFHWGYHNDWQSQTGTYEYMTPENINVVIIVRDTTCAVYVNNDPLEYFENCRTEAVFQASPQAVSFHVLGEPGYTSVITVDNVELWDLDKKRP